MQNKKTYTIATLDPDTNTWWDKGPITTDTDLLTQTAVELLLAGKIIRLVELDKES